MPKRVSLVKKYWKQVLGAIGVVALMSGAVKAVAESWEYIEPSIPATREFVRTAQNLNTSILRDVQIEIAEGKRDAAVRDKREIEKELSTAQDPVQRNRLQTDNYNAEATINKLNKQIETLNKLRQ